MTEATNADWHNVARLADVQEDAPLGVRVGNRLIALFNVAGQIYAIDNICSHEFAELSEGTQNGFTIECPLHQAHFDVRTGKALTPPATEDVRTFPVRVEAGAILVGLPRR